MELPLAGGLHFTATADLNEALADKEIVICAVPSHGVREVMGRAGKAMVPDAILISTVKGIEVETGMTMHRVLEDVLPESLHPRIGCVSGASLAREITEHKPTAVTLACREGSCAIAVQTTLSCPWFSAATPTTT